MIGVGHIFAAIASGVPMPLPLTPFAFTAALRARNVSGCSPSFETKASGVGQEEQSFPLMGSSNVGRLEHTPLDIRPQGGKPLEDFLEAKAEVSKDVLAEQVSGSALAVDPQDFGPEVPGVSFSESLPGRAERLARVSANDEIHAATPRSSVEGSQVTPDRSLSQPPFLHRCDQTRGRECFPFDVTDRASRSKALESKVDPADAGAETEGT